MNCHWTGRALPIRGLSGMHEPLTSSAPGWEPNPNRLGFRLDGCRCWKRGPEEVPGSGLFPCKTYSVRPNRLSETPRHSLRLRKTPDLVCWIPAALFVGFPLSETDQQVRFGQLRKFRSNARRQFARFQPGARQGVRRWRKPRFGVVGNFPQWGITPKLGRSVQFWWHPY